MQLAGVEVIGPRTSGIAGKDPESVGHQKEPAPGHPRPHLAGGKCSQQRATGGHVLQHENFERRGKAMDGQGRFELEPVGELSTDRRGPGLGLKPQHFAQTFRQQAGDQVPGS